MPKTVRYPESLSVRLRAGRLARLEAHAVRAGQNVGEWARDVLDRALQHADRAQRRREAASDAKEGPDGPHD